MRRTFYAVFAALFASGAAWWLVRTLSRSADDFESPAKAWETWLLRAHGAAAMAALIVFGILYPLHISRGWRMHRNRRWGGGLVLCFLALTATGYLLYYAAGEQFRGAMSAAHVWLGFAFPFVVWLHIWRGRAGKKQPPAH